jgi:hypothetical protein
MMTICVNCTNCKIVNGVHKCITPDGVNFVTGEPKYLAEIQCASKNISGNCPDFKAIVYPDR